MKRNHAAMRIPRLAMLAIAAIATVPVTAVSAEDSQADRDARRIEADARRQQEQARRDMEARDRTQAEALRSQEEAIRHMDATRARIEASTQQTAQQSADQARISSYSYIPVVPVLPDEPVSGMSLAPLSEKLGSYFGAQSGVLVVRAGEGAAFGLQDGDVILSIDGRVPVDGTHAAVILRSYRLGEKLKLQVQRNRKTISLDATAPTR